MEFDQNDENQKLMTNQPPMIDKRDTIDLIQSKVTQRLHIVDNLQQVQILKQPIYKINIPANPYSCGSGKFGLTKFIKNQGNILYNAQIDKTVDIYRPGIILQKTENDYIFQNEELEKFTSNLNKQMLLFSANLRRYEKEIKERKYQELTLEMFSIPAKKVVESCTSETVFNRVYEDILDSLFLYYIKLAFQEKFDEYDISILTKLLYPKSSELDSAIHTHYVLKDILDSYYKGQKLYLFLDFTNIRYSDHQQVFKLLEEGFKLGVGIEYIKGPFGDSGYINAVFNSNNCHPLSYVYFLDLEDQKFLNPITLKVQTKSIVDTVIKLSLRKVVIHEEALKTLLYVFLTANVRDIDLSYMKIIEKQQPPDLQPKDLAPTYKSAKCSNIACAQSCKSGCFCFACISKPFLANFCCFCCCSNMHLDYSNIENKLEKLQKPREVNVKEEVLKTFKLRNPQWVHTLKEALEVRLNQGKTIDYFFINFVNLGETEIWDQIMRTLGRCQALSCQFEGCNLGSNSMTGLVDLVRLSSRLVYLNYNGNFLTEEILQRISSISRVSPRFLKFKFDLIAHKGHGEKVSIEENKYQIQTEKQSFGCCACCFKVNNIKIQQVQTMKTYKIFRNKQECDFYEKIILDSHSTKGASRIIETINSEVSSHNAFSLRRIFTYAKDSHYKVRELIIYKLLQEPNEHPLFSSLKVATQTEKIILKRIIYGDENLFDEVAKQLKEDADNRLNYFNNQLDLDETQID